MKSKLLVILLMIFSGSLFGQDSTGNYFVFTKPEYAETDTVKCLFLEVIKTDSVITKWTRGFVIRHSGMITFSVHRSPINKMNFAGEVRVSPDYLILSSGVVKSKVFYSDMQQVKNMVIQIILTDPSPSN